MNSKILDFIEGNSWEFIRQREMSILENSLIAMSYKFSFEKLGLSQMLNFFVNGFTGIFEKGVFSFYRTSKNIVKINLFLSHFLNDERNYIFKIYSVFKKSLIFVVRDIEKVINCYLSGNFDQGYLILRNIYMNFFPLQIFPLIINEFTKNVALLNDKSEFFLNWRFYGQFFQRILEFLLEKFLLNKGRDFFYYTDFEIRDFILKGKKLNFDVINDRRKGCASFWDINSEKICLVFVDKNFRRIQKKFSFVNSNSEKTFFNGDVVSLGHIFGKVFVIRSKKDFESVPFGCILVANNFEIDDLMKVSNKKIKGLISEEGSLASHISVIAREWKIPVLTNVLSITNYLVNNSLVELDCIKGIVRLLN